MIIQEGHINPILRSIDLLYIERVINADEAQDLSDCITWIIGKSLNESNINYVVKSLRGLKNVMDEKEVSIIIKKFKSLCGGLM